MDLKSLKYAKGSRKNSKKIGRGGAHGRTATRGDKGQMSRSGAKRRRWFEGGQMPIQRRLPKRGFTNINREVIQIVNISDLQKFSADVEITPTVMLEQGLIKSRRTRVKVLGDGKVEKKLTVSAHAFSKTAREKIEAAGGKVSVL
jgi:large subunit ribosomal protein L15